MTPPHFSHETSRRRRGAATTAALILSLAWSVTAAWQTAGWYLVGLVSLGLTAIYSGAEIGLFSLSRVRLRLRTHRQEPAALQLASWLEKPTYALEGLLVLQNLCGFAFSAAVTGIMNRYRLSPTMQAVVSTAIITPIILVLSEVMPKDLFHVNADRWVYRLTPWMKWSFRLITVIPVLPVVHVLSWASTRLARRGRNEEPVGPRGEILQLFQESADTGVMSGTQQDLVQRALRLARITIREVMIPWNRVVGVPVAIGRDGFRAVGRHYNVSRLPVLGRNTTEVLGIVEVLDVLGDPENYNLRKHLTPAMTLIGEQSIRSAITLMQRARQTIAVVVDRQGRAIGLVTMKDLIEELVGDLENW